MTKYYVNTNRQPSGDYEVHEDGCFWLSLCKNEKLLGYYDSCRKAVDEAKRLGYDSANGCAHCSTQCHTG